MAGSYKHIVDDDNNFIGTELLDHLGDAYEALEECYDMIQWLTGGDKKKIHEAWLEGHIKPGRTTPIEDTHGYEYYWDE